MRISTFEFIDHGIAGNSYFPGCGTAYSDFDNIVTGIGENCVEAFDDCVEQIAQNHAFTVNGLDSFEERVLEDYNLKALPLMPAVDHTYCINLQTGEHSDFCDVRYFLSIRYNLEKEEDELEITYNC